ncbi:hypothetical protein FA15DRAFT_660185 [Coprinopsis marcescibilis]|uniref:Uncharacterized protein n=1 Tax=Coprinopsis marcescibilis TaxID=230819 RepID=A0A5C3KTC9_COPMA|nr:hypothetical protein FA15DRAFT_660185 [Coprinopsis marcescibilis]
MSTQRSYDGTSQAAVHYLGDGAAVRISDRRECWALYLQRIRGGVVPHPLSHDLTPYLNTNGRFKLKIKPEKLKLKGVRVNIRSGEVVARANAQAVVLTPSDRMAQIKRKKTKMAMGKHVCYSLARIDGRGAKNEAVEDLTRNRFKGYLEMVWVDESVCAGPTVAVSTVPFPATPSSGSTAISNSTSNGTSDSTFTFLPLLSEASGKNEREKKRKRNVSLEKEGVDVSTGAGSAPSNSLPSESSGENEREKKRKRTVYLEKQGVDVGTGAGSAPRVRVDSGLAPAAVSAATASAGAGESSTAPPPALPSSLTKEAPSASLSGLTKKPTLALPSRRAKAKELDAIWDAIRVFRKQLGQVHVPASSPPFIAYNVAFEGALREIHGGLDLRWGFMTITPIGSEKTGKDTEEKKHVPLAVARKTGGDEGDQWIVGMDGKKVEVKHLNRYLKRYKLESGHMTWTVLKDGKKISTVLCDIGFLKEAAEMRVVSMALKCLMKSLRRNGKAVHV